MTRVLGAREALNLLDKVVVEFGRDYVDPGSKPDGTGCDYTTVNSEQELVAGCIVGQVLAKVGADLEELDRLYGTIGFLEADVKKFLDIELTIGARLVLRAAQRVQDKGTEWGEALLAADDTFRILSADGID